MCARRVLVELRVVCVRRTSNRFAALYVGQYVQSTIVLLPGLCALDVCCPTIGLRAFDVNRTRDSIPVFNLFYVTAVLPLRRPICAVPDCAPADHMCAGRMLVEPRIMCVQR